VDAWQQQAASGFHMVPSEVAMKVRKDVRWSRRGFGDIHGRGPNQIVPHIV
jgi:hypothetical protein